MKKTLETIVFFGSGPVAAKSLQLLAKNFTIEAIITKPKPPHHHGSFPVLDLAEDLNLKVYTVSNKTQLSELIRAKTFNSPLGVLIDFGIIVDQDVIDCLPLGIVNSHFSILPDLRGADPITFAILSGQDVTGVSLMMLVAAMDEGPLIAYGEQPLDGTENTLILTNTLINLSDALLKHHIPRILSGEAKGASQDITGRKVSYSRKLTKQDGLIDWSKPARHIEREIRAFIDWPKSTTILAGKTVIITAVKVRDLHGSPGVVLEKKTSLIIACGESALEITKLKPAGKNEMIGKEFLAGHSHLI